MTIRRFSTRPLTVGYLCALSLIAVMSIASNAMLNQVFHRQHGAASAIDLTGRQRMRSQRIASLAGQYALGVPGAHGNLITAIDDFEAGHDDLTRGNPATEAPALDAAELQELYFHGDHPLAPAVTAYTAQARRIAAMAPSDPHFRTELNALFAAADPLLAGLHSVVLVRRRISATQVQIAEHIEFVSLMFILLTLAGEAFFVFRPLVGQAAASTRELMRMATIDPLTGLLNRRSFYQRAEGELVRARRQEQPTSVLAIDADCFKLINDTHGHCAGDEVLKALSVCLESCLRASDLLGRLGGEEFAIILADTDLAGASATAERIRLKIAALEVPTESGLLTLTVSIGVAEFPRQATTLTGTLNDADKALFAAKLQGRNCSVLSSLPITGHDACIAKMHAAVS